MQTKEYKIDFAGRPLVAEFSNLAEQANGSVIVKYNETVILATAVMSNNRREGIDFFPLTVDYEEKFYAVGKILGGRFLRREARPSEEAVLSGRMIDRTLRPLFDGRIRNEIQVITTTLSIDADNDPDVVAILAASLALTTSDIPWAGPIGGVRVGRIDNEFIINPTREQRGQSDLDLIVCGKDNKINMIDGKTNEVPEEIILKALEFSLPEIKKLIDFQNKIIKEIGKPKIWPEIKEKPEGMETLFEKHIKERLEDMTTLDDLKKEWMEMTEEKFGSAYFSECSDFFEENVNQIIHSNAIEKEKRPDGRKLNEVRNIFTKVAALPRAHGSGIFYRGQTHMLSVVTLGAPDDVLIIEGEVRREKRFMHHYNFPPFCSGEIGKMGGPGRRAIGHGALAEKALSFVIPEKEKFPHTIRIVSEALSSNGSTSMGAVCASTLALMDAGVPIKAPISGIAMGLMMKNEDKYKVLTDIQGPEDHHGDTDFKAAGTKKGITAIQMDVKVEGLTIKILDDLLKEGRKARLEILEKMLKTMPEPRKKLSPHAPKIIILTINPDKIRDVIGPGGKMIHQITETTGVEMDVEQDGKIFITSKNEEDIEKAKKLIEEITYEPKVGESFKGTVVKIMDFGAFVEIKPKLDGLVHISELAPYRVDKVTDIVNVGDIVPVKIIKIDEQGKISLSLKKADPDYAKNKQKK